MNEINSLDTWNDLPERIKDQMLKHQVEQGNGKSRMLFENDIQATKDDGGFDWGKTPAKIHIWQRIIEGEYRLFDAIYGEGYKKAPEDKKELPYWKTDHFSGFCAEHLPFVLEITENPEVAADQIDKMYQSLFVREEKECCDRCVKTITEQNGCCITEEYEKVNCHCDEEKTPLKQSIEDAVKGFEKTPLCDYDDSKDLKVHAFHLDMNPMVTISNEVESITLGYNDVKSLKNSLKFLFKKSKR